MRGGVRFVLGLARAFAALLAAGCGYQFASGAGDPLGPFVVEGGSALSPDAAVMAAAEASARAELARQGALAEGPGAGRSTMVVEVLRVDEGGAAEALDPAAQGGPRPVARALRLAVIGRARILRDGARLRDTGDVQAVEVIAAPDDPRQAALARDQAAARAARRLGERLARRLLGYPEPGEL